MLQRAFEHIGDDLHILMAVGVEAGTGLHPVLVDDPQRAEAHMGRVVIAAEGEAVMAVEPAEIGPASLIGSAFRDHSNILHAGQNAPVLVSYELR